MKCPGLHCGGCRSTTSGLGTLVALAAAVAVLGLAYRAADSALTGLAASTAAVNHAAAWVLGAVVVVAAVTGGGWLVVSRRRAVRDAPTVVAFRARVDAALTARDRAAQLAQASPRPVLAGPSHRGPVRVDATRTDRPTRPAVPGTAAPRTGPRRIGGAR